MYSDDTHIDEQRPVPDTGPLMFLSLFLLLLAFFILLTAISTLEETKSRDVLSSLAATFKNDVIPENTAEIVVSTLGPVPEPEDVIEDVERLWLTAVPIARVEELTRGRTLQLSLPATEVFVGGAAAVRSDRKDLFRATAFALSARLEGFSVQLSFTLPIERLTELALPEPGSGSDGLAVAGEPAGEADTAAAPLDPASVNLSDSSGEPLTPEQLPFLRAAGFVAALVEAGAPPDGISVGISERRTNRLRLRFEILDDTQTHVTLSDIDAAANAGGPAGGEQP